MGSGRQSSIYVIRLKRISGNLWSRQHAVVVDDDGDHHHHVDAVVLRIGHKVNLLLSVG